MKAGFRHLARQIVVKALFWHHARTDQDPELVIDYLVNHDDGRKLPDPNFAKQTFLSVVSKINEIDPLIIEYAPQWPLDKIAKVDLAILRLGIYELLHNDQIPPLVAINEAVELAKEFADKTSSQFINGVLSQLAKDKIGTDQLKQG